MTDVLDQASSALDRVTNVLDRATGRVTMYRLIVLCLLALVAASLLLSLFGALFYTPVEILVTGLVAVLATLGSGRLLGAIFRTRAHTESSVITGLLLLFLFRPTTDLRELGTVALAGVLASASKYLIAVRGRHILNPATAGALIVSLLQLNVSAWWVATGPLLPVTAAGAFLILHRTRRLPLGLVFIGLSAGIITAMLVANGAGTAEALALAFTSYPIVFLGGFMLTEPLTLPPRRWQQLTVAAVVAVLLSVPFAVGPLFSSPELALVLGNVLAFGFGQRRGIRLRYIGRTPLTPTSWEFEFQPLRRLSHAAGQYLELTLPHRAADPRGQRRIFTIASAPGSNVKLGLRMPERSSSFKRELLALEPGATITGTSVGGDFLLPRDSARPLLLVAGGIGITPFIAQLEHLEATGDQRDIVLVYTSSGGREIAYAERLQRLAGKSFRVLLIARALPDGTATAAELPPHWTWLGAGPLTGDMVLDAVPDAARRDAYVSGAPALVTALKRALRGAGVRRVKADYFTGY